MTDQDHHPEGISTIQKPGSASLVVGSSRFLASACHVTSWETAKDLQRRLRATHPDASHVVFALRTLRTASETDDGEPAGSAGRPLLRLLEERQLFDTGLFVVRFFGGRKLGLERLREAYRTVGRLALAEAQVERLVRRLRYLLVFTYTDFGAVHSICARLGIPFRPEAEAERVKLQLSLPLDLNERFEANLRQLCRGTLQWSMLGEEWGPAS